MIYLIVNETCLISCHICKGKRNGRTMTLRSVQKAIDMFPDENIFIISGNDPFANIKHLKKIATLLINNNKECWVETCGKVNDWCYDEFARMGVNFIIRWYGFDGDQYTGFYPYSRAMYLLENFPNIKIRIKTIIEQASIPRLTTTLELLISVTRKYPNLQIVIDYKRPKRSVVANYWIRFAIQYLKDRGCEIPVGIPCGGITITANTNIYPCPFMPRRNRKQFFGNADRDQNCIGTLRRGIFRDPPDCNYCEAVK